MGFSTLPGKLLESQMMGRVTAPPAITIRNCLHVKRGKSDILERLASRDAAHTLYIQPSLIRSNSV